MDTMEQLNDAIRAFKAQRTREAVMAVLETMARLKEQDVLVPSQVRPVEGGREAETRYKAVTTPGGRKLHICYATTEDAAAGLEAGALARVKLKDMLFAVTKQPEVDGLAVNPYTDDFVMKKELCAALVQEMKRSE